MRLVVTVILIGMLLTPLIPPNLHRTSLLVLAAQPPTEKAFDPQIYRGKVVGLTKATVTIQLEGRVQLNRVRQLPDGTSKEETLYIQDNNQPPREFVFHDKLLPRP